MTSQINPYAAPQSDPAKPPRLPSDGKQRRRKYATAMAVLLLIGSPLAAGVAVYDIESIVVSGAILSLFAIALIAIAAREDLRLLSWIGLAVLVMCVGCFLTIFLLSWSPAKAQVPIGSATVVFAVVVQLGWLFVRSVWDREPFERSVSDHNSIVDATDPWFQADQ